MCVEGEYCELRHNGVLGSRLDGPAFLSKCVVRCYRAPRGWPDATSPGLLADLPRPQPFAQVHLVPDLRFEPLPEEAARPDRCSNGRNSPFSSRSWSSGDGPREPRSSCEAAPSALASLHLRERNSCESTLSVRLSKGIAPTAPPFPRRRRLGLWGSERSTGSASAAWRPRSVFFAQTKALRDPIR
jgi:hypothetical protein